LGFIRDTVAKKISAAEAADTRAKQPSSTLLPAARTSARPEGLPTSSAPTRGPETDDLTRICAA
jgi:hypothetical protein